MLHYEHSSAHIKLSVFRSR